MQGHDRTVHVYIATVLCHCYTRVWLYVAWCNWGTLLLSEILPIRNIWYVSEMGFLKKDDRFQDIMWNGEYSVNS